MKIYNILLLLILIQSVGAFEYQEQALQPLSPPDTQSQRLFAPKIKTYPFLNQLESILYPNKNFKSENPAERLERLEMAVFGSKQKGNIGTRLNNLQTELENWQIGNMKAVKAPELNAQRSKLNANTERIVSNKYNNVAAPVPPAFSVQHSAPRDYNYMNYRLATPLLQNIGRRTIDAFFK